MRKYELTLIIDPKLAEKDAKDIQDKLKKWVTTGKGKIVKEEIWGRKKLAYPIAKKTEGLYFFYNLDLESDQVASLDKNLKLQENIMRYLLLRIK